jgi:hypothetical protein
VAHRDHVDARNARGDGDKVKKPANSITQMDLNLVNTKEHEEEAL